MIEKIICTIAVAGVALALSMAPVSAQPGPVATACKGDIAKFCAGKTHNGAVRACLDSNYKKVSQACKNALDSTGGGRGQGTR